MNLRTLLRRLLRRDMLATLKRRGLVVGERFYMQDGCIVDAWHCCHIRIGDDVTLGPNVTILAHDASTKRELGHVRIARVTIGNRVFVGAGSIVLPGVRIGDDVVIGAGSVVTQDIPSNSVAVGNPAKVTGRCDEYFARKREEMAEVPRFGEAYTLRTGATPTLLAEMNERMGDGPGYIV